MMLAAKTVSRPMQQLRPAAAVAHTTSSRTLLPACKPAGRRRHAACRAAGDEQQPGAQSALCMHGMQEVLSMTPVCGFRVAWRRNAVVQ